MALEDENAIKRVIKDILAPLLEADGGGIELLAVEPGEVRVALNGAFRGDPSAPYVQQRIVAPAIHKALGREVRVRFETSRLRRGTP